MSFELRESVMQLVFYMCFCMCISSAVGFVYVMFCQIYSFIRRFKDNEKES